MIVSRNLGQCYQNKICKLPFLLVCLRYMCCCVVAFSYCLVSNFFRDNRQNKGTILKGTVDYIKFLKRDQDRMKQVEDDKRQMEELNRKLLLRVQVCVGGVLFQHSKEPASYMYPSFMYLSLPFIPSFSTFLSFLHFFLPSFLPSSSPPFASFFFCRQTDRQTDNNSLICDISNRPFGTMGHVIQLPLK